MVRSQQIEFKLHQMPMTQLMMR